MAITVLNSLQNNGVLVSAFEKRNWLFTVSGAPSGYYCEITHNEVNYFRCTQITGTRWQLVADMLPTLIGYPDKTLSEGFLTTIIDSFIIIVYTSAGAEVERLEVDIDTILTFGFPVVGSALGMSEVLADGSTFPIYHNGKFCKFNSTSLEFEQITSTTQEKYYPADSDAKEIKWLNVDGGTSYWSFRLLAHENDNRIGNEVPVFAYNNTTVTSNRALSRDNNTLIYFDTIAVNEEHFAQLCDMSKFGFAVYDGYNYKIESCSKKSAVCNQNLHFDLILKRQDNAINY